MPFFWDDEMNRGVIIAICIALIISGLSVADSISSSIVTDGAAFVSSSVLGSGQTYAARLFTSDNSRISRDMEFGPGKMQSEVMALSSGPMGIDEYTFRLFNKTPEGQRCIFTLPNIAPLSMADVMYSGLLKNGAYYSARTENEKLVAETMINGTGMVLARAKSIDSNRTVRHKSDVAGVMNVSERMDFGGEG